MKNEFRSPRIVSLDLFRGIAVAGMIVVNSQGDWSHVYAPLRHAAWHGITPADLVFPFFLFAVGASISLAVSARAEAGASWRDLVPGVARRSAVLIIIGLILQFPLDLDFGAMRFPGVLQRIAVCYLIASLVAVYSRKSRHAAWALLLLAVYWTVLVFVPVPGHGPGAFTPMGNVCRWLDGALFGGHTYRHAPVPGFDPEGIVSTLGALATALLGMLAGHVMRSGLARMQKISLLSCAGLLGMAAGMILDIWLPVNKNLWTPAYALFTGGAASMTLAACASIDAAGAMFWAVPCIALGRNAIAVYVLSSGAGALTLVIHVPRHGAMVPLKRAIYETYFASWTGGEPASLLYSLMLLILWTLAALVLYRKGIIVRV